MTLTRTSTNRSNKSRHSRRSSHSHPTGTQPLSKTNSLQAAAAKASSGTANDGPDPLLGHLNHLSPEQTEALEAFKAVIAEKNLYTAAEGEKAASHDDSTLLRFLRARRFEVNGAVDQFSATEEWRKTNDIDTLYQNFDVDSYEEARRVYPQWTGRRDRRGIPIYVFVIKHLNSKNMAAYSSGASSTATSATHASSKVPGRLLRLFALYENMQRFVVPLCTSMPGRPHPETPIVNTTNIVDISGVGLKQFWNLKGHMQDASVLATAHYPETLDRIFIIGAPAFFPTVWGWIKRWFDPVTTSKIFILSASEVKSTLSSFMDPANIPKQYGGELEWQWGDMPSLDEPAKEIASSMAQIGPRGDKEIPADVEDVGDTRQEFVKGPVRWNGDSVDILGSVGGAERRRNIPVPQKKEVAVNGVQDAVTDAAAPVAVVDNEKVPGPANKEAGINETASQVVAPV
ncbi:hypothetical protein FQN55_007276 [Onygenales sp. PD_40]|nr:hypothetical protein FQN55_007276 [Onygenales sp. PD_40]